ncbi:MAG: helix-turn-helix domain-containing protein [Oscillospiraceae bacterium]|nr:helix-turn-helix domain-containing protein [Oscillospiraceae bacterium]
MEIKLHYTVKEVSRKLGIQENTVRTALKDRATGWDFHYLMAGNKIMIPKKTFDTWFENLYGIPEETANERKQESLRVGTGNSTDTVQQGEDRKDGVCRN